jgi:hypothetical protein
VKVTGLVLVLIGLLAGVICVVVLVQPTDPNQHAPVGDAGQAQRPNVILPLVMCGLAIVVGGAMWMFGGRSYNISNNPNVRK